MIEVGILAPGDQPDPDTSQWAFRKLNYLLDVWAAQRKFVPSQNFVNFNLVPGLSPHTIGPNSATWNVSQRPVRIESWALILNGIGSIGVNLTRRPTRDKDWFADLNVPNLQSDIPTDMYYDPTSPNGSCYFWPVPSTIYPVQLELWTLLAQFQAITDPVDGPGGTGVVPPAYRAAMMLSLAEMLQPGAAKGSNPSLGIHAAAARDAVFGNNASSPRSATADAGMTVSRRRADFNWEDGSIA